MKKVNFLVVNLMLFLTVGVYGQRTETIHLTEAGTFENSFFLIEDWENPVTKLKITGNIDARDLFYLNNFDGFSSLAELDLSEADIVEYNGQAGGPSQLHPANTLPDNSFGWIQLNLSKIILPKTLTSIGNMVLFANYNALCALTSLEIPEGITSIGNAFAGQQKALVTVSLPGTLTSLRDSSFIDCTGLTVIINNNPNPVDITPYSGVPCFYGVNKTKCTLYVPAGSKSLYEKASIWQEFNIIELPETTEITETPTTDGATIEWQPYENAEGYRLIIYSDEARTDTIYIFEFDADGEWFNTISFRSASTTLSHTIENLQRGTDYFYTLEILGVGDVVLASQSGEFTTASEPASIDAALAEPAEIVGYYSVSGAKLPKAPEKGAYIVLYSNDTSKKILK